MKFGSKEAQNSTSLPPFWTVLISQAAFSWGHSVWDILSKWLPTNLLTTTLGYGCSWAVLFWAKHAPNSKNDSSEDSEVDNRLLKIHFAGLVKDAKSVAGFSPCRQFRVWRNDVAWLPRKAQNGSLRIASFETNFIRIAGTSEAETSVSKKGECLLATGEGKKVSLLEWPSPLSKQIRIALPSYRFIYSLVFGVRNEIKKTL